MFYWLGEQNKASVTIYAKAANDFHLSQTELPLSETQFRRALTPHVLAGAARMDARHFRTADGDHRLLDVPWPRRSRLGRVSNNLLD